MKPRDAACVILSEFLLDVHWEHLRNIGSKGENGAADSEGLLFIAWIK